VTTATTATLTATAGGVTKTFALQLNVGGPALTVDSTTIAFGNVDLDTPATQAVTLTSSGTSALTLSAGTLAGTGFTMSGVTFPATLNPGQSVTLNLQFDPAAAGAITGTVTLTSDATAGSTTVIHLTGTGISNVTYSVDLTWAAPASSSDAVAGYKVYRATGSGAYMLLTSSAVTGTTYADANVTSGTTYSYEVTSVDAAGLESTPSNIWTGTIP
jgi:hypothetical protein